jgi:multiple sugar transport system ATP-binding protein
VDVGIRPEHLHDAGDEAPRIAPVVEVFEPLGSDTLAICRLGGHELTARLSPDAALSRDQRIGLSYDRARLHYFDGVSGARLGSADRFPMAPGATAASS